MKKIQRIVSYARDIKGYNYLILTKSKINQSLQDADFDHYIFNFVAGTNGRYKLNCLAYTVDETPIGDPFNLNVIDPPKPKNLRNLQRGIFRLSKSTMLNNGIDGTKKIYFVPVRYRDQIPGPDYVSYDLTDDLESLPLIRLRIDPSPPAR